MVVVRTNKLENKSLNLNDNIIVTLNLIKLN